MTKAIDCAYTVEGQGPALFLIHGIGARKTGWTKLVEQLKDDFTCISYDLRGHGESPMPEGRFGLEDLVADLEALRARLGIETAHVAGHSLGGAVAWTFAATRPDRVSQLVLVDSAGYPRDSEADAPLMARLARTPLLGDVGIYFKPESQVRRALADAYADPAQATPERVRRAAELQRFPGNREATLQRARTQEPLDPTPLKRMDVPTLIIWGGKDRWVPAADALRFQADIKGAQLEIFSALGHNPMEEDPKATAATVIAFLAGAPLPPPPAEPAPPPEPEPAGNADHAVQPSVMPEKD